MSWNVRGIGGAEKRRSVKERIRKANPVVVLLQESKLGGSREKDVLSFAESLNYSYTFVPAVDAAGGLISLWREAWISVEDVFTDERFIGILVKVGNVSNRLLIVNAYGPNTEAERVVFFDRLQVRLEAWDGPIILGGGPQCDT